MRRPYPTDLSDAEWFCLEPHLPTPKAPGRPRVHSLREILNAIYYTSSEVVVLDACCHMSFRLGRPSTTTTSELGASMVPGSGYTLPCASVCEYASREILNPAQALPTPKRLRPPGSAASRGDTTEVRRCAAGSVTCWWTPRVWFSKPRCKARRCPTRMDSGSYSCPRRIGRERGIPRSASPRRATRC
jgi:hypothetical protein